MSTRKLTRAVQHLFHQVSKLVRTITKGLVNWLLRGLLMVGRRSPASKAGFVLPTTVLLLLIVTLTVGSITLRTFTRTNQTIGDRQQRVIYNTATPTIDRAKAKLEFLFNPQRDTRFPGGVPGESQLMAMMLNDGQTIGGIQVPLLTLSNGNDPYRFPDETRIDLNRDGQPDNAWRYRADTDGDGREDASVVYSIIFGADAPAAPLEDTQLPAVRARANRLQVRHGPLSNATEVSAACRASEDGLPDPIESGWFPNPGRSGELRKNFQVNAYVLPDNSNGTASTIEFHQDRQINRGNLWGAWFRNDLEIFPGPQFNWNGAMHTEGNLVVGKPGSGTFTAYLISSKDSCLYSRESSKISIASRAAEQGFPAFQAQAISGTIRDNDFGGNSVFHLYNAANPITTGDNNVRLDDTRDSVVNNGPRPGGFALDPVALLTQDVSVARGVAAPNIASTYRDAAWADRRMVQEGRIVNESQPTPSVDDGYRADNRFGPRPRYGNRPISEFGADINIGEAIPAGLTQLIGDVPEAGQSTASVGLDGYWERRANLEGLRLIVGQRLELGDPVGWGGVGPNGASRPVAEEPLRPWTGCTTNNGRCNEARQRRALTDNLAAVQAMAVYHSARPNNGLPLACVALTAHPGTPETLRSSTTFENLDPSGSILPRLDSTQYPANSLISDFFSGRGTNGWEYEAHPLTAYTNINSPLMNSLRNLAHFAGDPRGGAPSFTPVQDNQVHPYPSMAMWGDFSILRRIFNEYLDNGVPYANLSPADQTALHTAGCAVGMLVQNMGYLGGYDYATPNNNLNELALRLSALSGASAGSVPGKPTLQSDPPFNPDIKGENYIRGLRQWQAQTSAGQRASFDALIPLAQMVLTKEQVERDRRFGFREIPGATLSSRCATNFGSVAGGQIAGLANLCSPRPKYPILYALFPLPAPEPLHGESGGSGQTRDSEDRNNGYTDYINTVNTGYQYRPVDIDNIAVVRQIALRPRQLPNWILPHEPAAGVTPTTTPNNNRDVVIKACPTTSCLTTAGPLERVGFKDSALFNGREMMSVRTLDVNLELLRTTQVAGTTDYWFPLSGIVYAFREDGVREGSVVRPQGVAMNTGTLNAFESVDPPLNAANSISPKPVDYYADPDRRPHGFRLRRGARLDRVGDAGRGLSFVSDNPVYIQGNFNLHQATEGGAQLEEFGTPLAENFGNFYTRTGRDPRFARIASDRWRPSEVFADAVTILSDNFCDGSIQDSFTTAGVSTPTVGQPIYGCTGHGNHTSYLNQNRPSRAIIPDATRWQRSNPADPTSPIKVSRDGNPVLIRTGSTTESIEYGAENSNQAYYTFTTTDGKQRIVEAETRVNAIIISGLVPSQPNQSYGGLHNFPRFIGNWSDRRLYLSGSLLQLNFSNYATGPFDQDAWEPGSAPLPREDIRYYQPPTRVWGYDVGLQYAPAGPIAQRFVTSRAVRSEFYNEPPADDPYITNLCRALAAPNCPGA